MDRRSFFAWLSSSFAAGTVAAAKPEPCVTPAYAGFDGSFHMGRGRHKIILARASVNGLNRYTGLVPGMMGVWKNDDKSVSKLVYRNRDGKLFSLEFVPMEEPT